jgi:micrococcal nuclease
MFRRMRRLTIVLAAVALSALPATAEAAWTGTCLPQVPPAATPASDSPMCNFRRAQLLWVNDGDTIDVRMPTSTGKSKHVRVRITGIQAMEHTVYNSNPFRRRGHCHALQATERLEQLIRRSRGVVRLGAQDETSVSGRRARRSVAVKVRGSWQDVGSLLVAEGHALWHSQRDEQVWNVPYNTLAQEAAAARVNLWDTDFCGGGPAEPAPLRVHVTYDPKGYDDDNVNGEQVTIQNLSPDMTVPLGGWWLRDSSLKTFGFPSWAVIPPGGTVTVHVGRGTNTSYEFYWGRDYALFDNSPGDSRGYGDGAYLFDFQGDLRAWMTYPCYLACAPQ